jgi:pimeloyl-ACP methyl ester carboxylesterase
LPPNDGGGVVVDASSVDASSVDASSVVPTVRDVPCVGLEEYRHPAATCARVTVPVSREESLGDIELYVLRVPATAPESERLGTLVIPSSGPGVPSASGYGVENLIASLPAELASRFDYLTWDERGTAESSRVECSGADRLLRYLGGFESVEDAERTLGAGAESFAASCEGSRELLRHLRPEDNALDLESLRLAFDMASLTVYGTSYGSMVALRYAEAYPSRVRGVLVDSPFDPELTLDRWVREQHRGRERYLNEFFEWCAEPSSGCVFAPEATNAEAKRAALVSLRERLIESPTDGVQPLDLWLSIPLSSGFWESWSFSLEEARAGRLRELPTDEPFSYAVGIADVGDSVFDYWDANGYLAVACGLNRNPPPNQFSSLREELDGVFEQEAAYEYFACSALVNAEVGVPAPLAYRGEPRIAVVWAENDPATPREWALRLLEQLGERGSSISLDASVHAGALLGVPCVDDAVLAYLADPTTASATPVRCTP